MNIFAKLLAPKNKVFYDLFEKSADNVKQMGVLLTQVVTESDFDKRQTLISKMEDLEHANDELTHNLFTELGRNFITPFDREDIHYLASALDDIADFIFASAKKVNFYRVNPNDIGIHKLAEIIVQSTNEVRSTVGELRTLKNMRLITESLVRINSLENEADDIFDMSIERLFATEPDAKEVIKKREIYQVMETATDKCEDAANVIATIVSTKVLTPFQAVVWAALFNFAAFFIFKDHGVANTVAKTVHEDWITLPVVFSGLIAAIGWNLITWWFGIPSSSSHTLIGGFAGAGIAHAGTFAAIEADPVIKTVSFIFLAPLVGMIVAFIISLWFIHAFQKGMLPKLISFAVIVFVIIFLW